MSEIVQAENPILRNEAKEVPLEMIGDPKIKKLIAEMKKVLNNAPDGIALAAPQIGESWRIFVVSPKAFPNNSKYADGLVAINPVIKKLSAKKIKMEEGCLSVRNVFGHIKRAEKVTIEAYNEKGFKFVKTGLGLLAQIFQHETDHLVGQLFIDRATDLYQLEPENQIENK